MRNPYAPIYRLHGGFRLLSFAIFIYVCNILFLPSKYTDIVSALLLFIRA
nr:MAG TPA: hypothetical protein [Caudoviricetes sp.]